MKRSARKEGNVVAREFVGCKIIEARYMSKTEARAMMGWARCGMMLVLDNGDCVFAGHGSIATEPAILFSKKFVGGFDPIK